MLKRLIFFIFTLFFSEIVFADISLGQAADNILVPLGALNQIIYTICYILGTAMLGGSLIQYKAHRDNPSNVRLTQPIMLLIIGLILIGIPYLVQVSSGANILQSNPY